MLDFLDWLAKAGGATASVLIVVGFVFREKWKQILAKSMAHDVERLKADLAKEHADHLAALAPQLEEIKHDFQQKLEAYKVSLIAEAEAAKARSELKKSIALRLAEIEFERLVALESELGPIYPFVLSRVGIAPANKTIEQWQDLQDRLARFDVAADRAEMFMTPEDRLELLNFKGELIDMVGNFGGPGRPAFDRTSTRAAAVVRLAASTHMKLKTRLIELGKVP